MTGTEKQVVWAERIKTDALGTVQRNLDKWKDLEEKERYLYGSSDFSIEVKVWKSLKEELSKALDTYEDAGKLIANREAFDPFRIVRLADEEANRERMAAHG